MNLISNQVLSTYKNFYNFIINLLPDDLISNQYIRPRIAHIFGMECQRKCYLRKRIYYVYPERVKLGDNVYISNYAYLDAVGSIVIGDNVRIGYQVSLITATHQIGPSENREGLTIGEPITIGNGCWIGARTVVAPGVTIGSGSVVTVGSVVTRDIPPNSFVAGNPARPIKKLPEQ